MLELYKCGDCGHIMFEYSKRCTKCGILFYKVSSEDEERREKERKVKEYDAREEKIRSKQKAKDEIELPKYFKPYIEYRNDIKEFIASKQSKSKYLLYKLLTIFRDIRRHIGKDIDNNNLTSLDIDKLQIFKDPRDGKKYLSMQIGSQIWMAENLAYKIDGCMAYHFSKRYVPLFGYHYNYQASCLAAPPGWHLPTIEEWNTLKDFLLNGKEDYKKDELHNIARKLTSDWDRYDGFFDKEYNETGFSALPCGLITSFSGSVKAGKIGGCCSFWSSTNCENCEDSFYRNYGYAQGVELDPYNFSIEKKYSQDNFLSVRCVKD